MGKAAIKNNIDSVAEGESAFFGADPMEDLSLTEEEIAIRDGIDLEEDENGDSNVDDDSDSEPDGDQTDGDDEPDTDADPEGDPASGKGDDADGKADDGDADPDSDDAASASADGERRAIMVPKARLDSALERARRAEALLLERTPSNRKDAPAALDLEALDLGISADDSQKMFDAAVDGKMDVAHELFSRLVGDSLKKTLGAVVPQLQESLRHEMSTAMDSTLTETSVEAAFSEAVDTVYTDYPFMNPKSDTFEKEVLDDAITFQQGYESRGYSPAVAVLMGTEKALRLHKPQLLSEGETLAPAPTRKKTDAVSLKRNAAASKAQPASSEGSLPNKGNDAEGEVNIDNLTDEEFDALPAATRARLRGDFG
jgi:hypothetical protein